jgi:hypothetical protein
MAVCALPSTIVIDKCGDLHVEFVCPCDVGCVLIVCFRSNAKTYGSNVKNRNPEVSESLCQKIHFSKCKEEEGEEREEGEGTLLELKVEEGEEEGVVVVVNIPPSN